MWPKMAKMRAKMATGARTCYNCQNEPCKCDARKKMKHRASFDKFVLEHSQKHGRRLVCTACATPGYRRVVMAKMEANICQHEVQVGQDDGQDGQVEGQVNPNALGREGGGRLPEAQGSKTYVF